MCMCVRVFVSNISISIVIVPNILPHVQCDRGAIRFVLSGANIMCPGLTSAGGRMNVELDAGVPVVRIYLLVSIVMDIQEIESI